MTFLAPALLALGLAATVPLALHLLQRRPGPRVVFPALRYLRRAERESATRIRLRQILLLVLRVLAVLGVAVAAARPLLPLGGRSHPPTSVVLLLDNSMSTGVVVGDRRVLDELKAAAGATLGAAGPDDRFWLIRAGEPWEPAVTGSPAAVAEAIDRVVPAAGAADLAAELERAATILAAEPRDRPREIHLLSDLQSAGWRALEPRPDAPAVRVLRPSSAPTSNRAVTAVQVGGGLPPRAGERSSVAATVAVWRTRPEAAGGADSVAARLVVDGSVRAAGVTPAGAALVLPFPVADAGLVTGSVELDADDLTADDRRHFVVEVRAPAAVALADSFPFLEEALQVLEQAGRVRRVEPRASEVVLAPGARGLTARRSGSAVVVLPPSSTLELAAVNQRLAAAGIPLRYGLPRGGETRLGAQGTGLEAVLGDARLRQVYPLERSNEGGDTVLVRLRTGEPWAVAGSADGGGRYVALATPLVPEGGTIPTSAAMLPLLDRAINGWAAGATSGTERRPGDVVTLPAADSVIRPDGQRGPVAGSVLRLEEAGIYRFLRAGAPVAAWAVNPPAAESDLTRVADGRLAALLPGRDVRVAGSGEWSRTIFRRRRGREATPLLAAALLVLLLVESLVAATGRRDRAAAPPAKGR